MKQTRIIMGMPVSIEIADYIKSPDIFEKAFSYFIYVDNAFSTFKEDSEISLINRGEIKARNFSADMKTILALSEETKIKTNGYFNILAPSGKYDPSGLVKGWAIQNVSKILEAEGFKNFYVEAGGDIQIRGKNSKGNKWKIGVRNPFNNKEIIKTVFVQDKGVATSGTYIRGQHIYDPHRASAALLEIVSLTVIGPNIYEADRFATAAFAMGKSGIFFIEKLEGFEGYMVDKNGKAAMTSGFETYTKEHA